MSAGIWILVVWLNGIDGPAFGPFAFDTEKDCKTAQTVISGVIKHGIVSCGPVLSWSER